MYSKSKNIVLLINLLFLLSLNFQEGKGFGFRSQLKRGPSYANSLSYLYHGLPRRVVGLSFAYDDNKKTEYESYILKLLANPKRDQLPIRDCAMFLVTRLYIDDQRNPVLIMGEQDAATYVLFIRKQLAVITRKDDKLLAEALLAIFKLGLHDTSNSWSQTSEKIVRNNVLSVCKRIRIETKLGRNWNTLSLDRGDVP